jgi:glycosyltransferase involved in cell wall biosynthesis
MHHNKEIIEIWSSYPPPYGGVSIHSMRLFHILKSKYNLVLKNFNGNLHNPEIGIFKVNSQLKEILIYLFKRNRNIHLHSNRLLVWLIMIFYSSSNNLLVTLHNQNLRKKLPLFHDLIVRIFLKKTKFIFLNDCSFADFLTTKYNLQKNKMVVIPAFIPPLDEEKEELPEELSTFFNRFDKIISSFAWKLYCVDGKDVYGIDHIIEAFNLVKKKYQSVGLVLIIPLIDDQFYYKHLLKKINDYCLNDCVLIYNNSIRNGFDVWGKSDVFLRSTITDIEGISVKEALV